MSLASRIAIYARVSSDQQAQHNTIASQLGASQVFAATQGVKVDPDLIFADNGISGTTLMRPKLDLLRDRAVAGDIDHVSFSAPIVWLANIRINCYSSKSSRNWG
jgi:site-specific DNA recombinase